MAQKFDQLGGHERVDLEGAILIAGIFEKDEHDADVLGEQVYRANVDVRAIALLERRAGRGIPYDHAMAALVVRQSAKKSEFAVRLRANYAVVTMDAGHFVATMKLLFSVFGKGIEL